MRTTLLVTLATVALAGCGGGSGGGSYAQALSTTLASVSQPASLDADTLAKLSHGSSEAAARLGDRNGVAARVGDAHLVAHGLCLHLAERRHVEERVMRAEDQDAHIFARRPRRTVDVEIVADRRALLAHEHRIRAGALAG